MCVCVKSTGKRESFPSVPPAFIGPKHVEKRAGHALGTRRARVPKACCQTRVGTRVGQLRTCLLCRSFLRGLGPKGAERPTVGLPNVGLWVLSYVARSCNSLLSSPYLYVRKSVGVTKLLISNTYSIYPLTNHEATMSVAGHVVRFIIRSLILKGQHETVVINTISIILDIFE
jgi:hypothetical protein